MASPRLPVGNDVDDDSTGDDFRFANEEEARDYINKFKGRSTDQLVRVAHAGAIGFHMAPLMAALKQCAWLWGDHGPGNKPIPDAISDGGRMFLNPNKETPTELGPVMAFARDVAEGIDLARKLIPVAGRIRTFLETTPGASKSILAWDSEMQMFSAVAQFAAEEAGFDPPLGRKELEAFALLVGIRRPVSQKEGDGQGEFLVDPNTVRERAGYWAQARRRAERNRIVPVLRATVAPPNHPRTVKPSGIVHEAKSPRRKRRKGNQARTSTRTKDKKKNRKKMT